MVAVLVAVSGCRPSAPDAKGWQSSAEQAVSDMVSEVATSWLTVRQTLQHRFVGRYQVVTLTYAEEAARTAADSVSSLQPPPSARPGYDQLTAVLTDAADAISRARVAVTDRDAQTARKSASALTRELARLRRLQDRLRAAR